VTETEESSHPSSEPAQQNVFDSLSANWWDGGEKVKIGQTFTPRKIQNPLDRINRKQGGRRSRTRTERKRGRYIQARPANGKTNDLAFDATLRAAAPFQNERAEQRKRVAFAIKTSDLQRKVRIRKAANLILFLLDASWSMAAAQRMAATKGALLSLLQDAYQKRDRGCLVVFQKDRARVVLPPTHSVELARRLLADLQVGGRTPLSHGLLLACELLQREQRKDEEVRPLLIILTDGAGNVSYTGRPPEEEAWEIAHHIRARGIHSAVVNAEHASLDRGLAGKLARALGAVCYTLTELGAQELYETVRHELAEQPKSKRAVEKGA